PAGPGAPGGRVGPVVHRVAALRPYCSHVADRGGRALHDLCLPAVWTAGRPIVATGCPSRRVAHRFRLGPIGARTPDPAAYRPGLRPPSSAGRPPGKFDPPLRAER